MHQQMTQIRQLLQFLELIISMMNKGEGEQKYIVLTYRSNIVKKLATTYYDSDSGWGCMLRVGQMAIANLLYLYEKVLLQPILLLFWDNSCSPFSIQNFTQCTTKIIPHKKPYQWYNPCQMGFIMKDLLQMVIPNMSTIIFKDNSIFLSEILSDKPIVLIMIMIRIGLQEPQEIYLPVVQSLMQNQYFFSALGGTPKHAHLFLKCKDQKVGYLDPHTTKKAAINQAQIMQKSHEYLSELSWIKLNKIDSSMGLIFRLNREQINSFWSSLQKLKQTFKQRFFIYMQKERPDLNQDDLIQITDQDFQ